MWLTTLGHSADATAASAKADYEYCARPDGPCGGGCEVGGVVQLVGPDPLDQLAIVRERLERLIRIRLVRELSPNEQADYTRLTTLETAILKSAKDK